jgi:ornithine cyclodeaminase/alanine dehydrogenase-like protein (mu-crystallin family)
VSAPQARWLSDAQVASLLPPPGEAAELARSVLIELAEGTIEQPPKPAIHPRPDGFVNVMPAYCAGLDGSGVKLVSAFPGNRERDLPAINALVIVLDSATGLVRGLLGGAALTACRTAAASAACIARLAPAAPGHVAITGAGVEARSHLLALDALDRREVVVWDHRASNLDALRAWTDEHAPAVALRPAASPSEAAEGAAVVITGIPIGATGGHVEPGSLRSDVLALPIDYSTSITAASANRAALLLADDVAQLDGYRGAHFEGWRAIDGPVGRWLADGAPGRPAGQVVVANLGVGAHDVVFGSAVLARAERDGIGVLVTP